MDERRSGELHRRGGEVDEVRRRGDLAAVTEIEGEDGAVLVREEGDVDAGELARYESERPAGRSRIRPGTIGGGGVL
jgi:hypothetical protein